MAECDRSHGWRIALTRSDADHAAIDDTLLTIANGVIGIKTTSLLVREPTKPFLVVNAVYHDDGPETRLLTGPVPAGLGLAPEHAQVSRALDMRTGVVHERVRTGERTIECASFVSLTHPRAIAIRITSSGSLPSQRIALEPTDDLALDAGDASDGSWMRVASSRGGGIVAAITERRVASDLGETLDVFVAYDAATDVVPTPACAIESVADVAELGFDALLAAQRAAWDDRWSSADVVIEGDNDLQLATRFALFHLIACASDGPETAVGARGLTGPGYRGHVFWDADTFVLPFLAATHPASARAMLEYRLRRLPAARAAARQLGRDGARFPWESAATGRDVTPTSARDRAGHLVPIRTGQLEEHIVADVAWAACCYYDWTYDASFAASLVTLLVETARYWASRVRFDREGRAHIFGVIGPDEYHEPVDDNAFTNVMARWNLTRAADSVSTCSDDVTTEEVDRWRTIAGALVDGFDPATRLYEQFAGFADLEPLIIEEVAPRRPIAADLLLGAARVRGAQVLKQADVLMLHHLVPDAVAPDSLDANLRYYEPRTAHGSSLSPAIHASLFARARDLAKAAHALQIASRIDLDDLTGSTMSGVHVATMGGLWQAFAYGFAGLRPTPLGLAIDPRLLPSWSALELRVGFRGARLRIHMNENRLVVSSDRSVDVIVGGRRVTARTGDTTFTHQGGEWEVLS